MSVLQKASPRLADIMCGIAGIIADSESLVRQRLTWMLHGMAHRGPDDQGVVVVPFGPRFLGLGQRRLSVLDLSPAGHQPMTHPGTGDLLIYNGEIYNYARLRAGFPSNTFTGTGDTEVLLHLLGRDGTSAVRALQGMFAFAYFDRQANVLTLARDPMGIKPLYLAYTPDGLVFASEVRAIVASGLVKSKIDPGGLGSLLAYGAVQQPGTIFRDIASLAPGALMHWTPADIDARRAPPSKPFWTPPPPDLTITAADAVERVRSSLSESVRDHLVSDVPLALFLSSGLDSTIIAGLAARHAPRLRSFTVGFADEPEFSEHALASQTATLLGLDHTAIDITGDQAQAAVEQWLGAMDQPSMDGLNVYLIARAVRQAGIVVALSGQGGDELFGGYPSFVDVPRARGLLRPLGWMPPAVRASLARAIAWRRQGVFRDKLIDMARSAGGIVDLALLRRRTMSDAQLAALGVAPGSAGLGDDFLPPAARAGLIEDSADPIWTISLAECRQYQGNTLLRDADSNGMAHSLEIRVPFLGQQVLDAAMTIPGSVRLPKGAAPKHLLRQAFGDLLRPQLSQQKKRGFTLPIRRWMIGPLKPMCEAALAALKNADVLKEAGIDAIWRQFLDSPESPIWSRAWTLVVLGEYVRKQE